MKLTSVLIASMVAGGALLESALAADAPAIEFNADYVASCKDVTPKNYPEKGKRVVEAVFRLSTKVVSGTEKDLNHVIYSIADKKAERTMYVTDYLPKTELKSTLAEPAVVIEWKGSGSIRYALTPKNGVANGQFQASRVEYKVLPPLDVVVASGVEERGYGLFVKLKPSTQTTVEGDRVVSCLLTVPKEWRGGCLHVRCEASGTSRGLISFFDTTTRCGLAGFVVALYVEGDAESEKLAKRVAEQQQRVFDAIIGEQKKAKKSWLGTLLDWLALFLKLSGRGQALALNAMTLPEVGGKGEARAALGEDVAKRTQDLSEAMKRLDTLHPK